MDLQDATQEVQTDFDELKLQTSKIDPPPKFRNKVFRKNRHIDFTKLRRSLK
jgi:hypothetical protein